MAHPKAVDATVPVRRRRHLWVGGVKAGFTAEYAEGAEKTEGFEDRDEERRAWRRCVGLCL
jgi:hypothetical protein